MTTYNVSIPNEKSSFFKEFLDLIGAKYTEENNDVSDFVLSEKQKSILTEQNDISVDDCIDAEEFYNILKKKYEL